MRFPDIEPLILAFIRSHVGGVRVATKVPADRPATFVRAWANGGSDSNPILESVGITIDVWAPDQPTASRISEDIRTAMLWQLKAAIPLVRSVETLSRPTTTPDETSERYRATYTLRVRATRT